MNGLGTLWQDIRYAIRTLAKNPGFTAVAVLSLTLGIGGTTTIFTLVKAVFLQSVPVKDPATALIVYSTQQTADGKVTQFLQNAYLNSKDYRERNDVFTGLSMFVDTGIELKMPGSVTPEAVDVQLVNWDFFDILGVSPAIGRSFSADEDQIPDARPVAILSYALWNTKFGADPHVVGRNIRLGEQDYSIIGVMPKRIPRRGHDWKSGCLVSDDDARSIADGHEEGLVQPSQEPARFYGRPVKTGISISTARTSMTAMGNRLAQEYPAENSGRNVVMVPLSETNVAPQQRSLFVLVGTLLMVIVGLVLLIACGNVANLLLGRAMQRRRELAIRLSLGASRGRLIRQLLTESLLLGLAAAALGIVCAYWARDLLWTLLPGGRPEGLDFSLDARVLLFTLGLSVVSTLLFGLVPSLQASKPSQMTVLRDRTDAPSGTGHWYGLRGMLVAAQIAFSLIALVVRRYLFIVSAMRKKLIRDSRRNANSSCFYFPVASIIHKGVRNNFTETQRKRCGHSRWWKTPVWQTPLHLVLACRTQLSRRARTQTTCETRCSFR